MDDKAVVEEPRKKRQKPNSKMFDEVSGKMFTIPFWRNSHGIDASDIKIRSCLKCQDRFPSFGPQNRLCPSCKANIDSKGLLNIESCATSYLVVGESNLLKVV